VRAEFREAAQKKRYGRHSHSDYSLQHPMGDLATVVDWTERGHKKNKADTPQRGMSASVVAETRNRLDLLLSIAATPNSD
jgi:hypothetical protein